MKSSTWCALILDGIRLSSDRTAVVALGIDSEGRKHVLDFALGSREILEVSRGLVSRVVARGFRCEHGLFAVLDGSDTLRGAVKEFLPDAVVKRCLVHKELNFKKKLSKRHRGELPRLFRRLRSVQDVDAVEGVFEDLKAFLEPINAEAYRRLHEAGDDLLALQRLNVPNTLHRSLLSTNAIDNSFLNRPRKLDRVTRFRAETDQASRWISYALLEAEKGFRRISGHALLIYFLNEGYHGGVLKFDDGSSFYAAKRSAVIWKNTDDSYHEVTEVLTGERHVFASWLGGLNA